MTRLLEPDRSGSGSGSTRTTPRTIALTQLQADAFVTLNMELANRLEGVVAIASIDAML